MSPLALKDLFNGFFVVEDEEEVEEVEELEDVEEVEVLEDDEDEERFLFFFFLDLLVSFFFFDLLVSFFFCEISAILAVTITLTLSSIFSSTTALIASLLTSTRMS